MRIYSWNVNGLRAVHKKEALQTFIQKEKPDVLLLQEIKGKEEQFEEIKEAYDFQYFFNPAEKAGYSGVAIWVKPSLTVSANKKGMPKWKDGEGRVIRVDIDTYSVISVYVPNGGKSEEAYKEKLTFYTLLNNYGKQLQKEGRNVIIGGDFNVARSELDLAEPEKHKDHTHFNDEVRSHMEKVVDNFTDTYRSRHLNKKEAYTYWDNFDFSLPKGTRPRDINKGWRLDYLLVDEKTDGVIKKVAIHNAIMGSDHCPISIYLP